MTAAATPPNQRAFPKIPDHVADHAGLLVNFYGLSDKLNPLMELFKRGLSLQPTAGRDNLWQESTQGKEIYLTLFEKPSGFAHDTAIVQIALNEPGEASEAWGRMWSRLENIGLQQVLDNLASQGLFWGYTLIYQAEQKSQFDYRDLLPLAQAEVMNGYLWLLAIPMGEEGIEAAMSYVALVPVGQSDPLATKVLFGSRAALLAPDLIAHKGYYHIRQYRVGGYKEFYENQVKLLREALPSLLNDVSIDSKKMIKTSRFVYLSMPFLDAIRVAISQQLYNYNLAQESNTLLKNGDLLSYHCGQLKTAFEEIKLLADSGRSATDVARTEIERANEERENRREKEDDRRERKLEMILAMIGIGLAIAQVVDTDTANKILGIPWVSCENLRMLTWDILTCQYISEPWRPLAVKTFMTLIPFIIWLIIQTLLYLLPQHEQHESPQ